MSHALNQHRHHVSGWMSARRAGAFAAVAAVLLPAVAPADLNPSPRRETDPFIGEEVPHDIDRMVQRAQNFLARSQGDNGIWSNPGGQDGPGIQGLALLALLADGEDPRYGRHSAHVIRGTNALIGMQDTNGYFGPSMYHHGFATLALAEVYGTIDDPRLGPALQRAVALILDARTKSQHGAWRYSPTSTDADTTVSGVQMVALFAARNAGLDVPDAAIDGAIAFFDSVLQSDGSIGYTSASGGGTGPRNAIAVLVADLADQRDRPIFTHAWAWLRNHGDSTTPATYLFYYLYNAAQAFFRADMPAWRVWNRSTADRLLQTQNTAGGWDAPQGSVFCTAAAVLAMAPNYRYLPIYER